MRQARDNTVTGSYAIHEGDDSVVVSVPVSGGENVMVPVVRAIVRSQDDESLILLQRRDVLRETVRGKLEIPGGRWRSGESPAEAVAREVHEETGVVVTAVDGVAMDSIDGGGSIASVHPLVVCAGVDGAFPAAHMVLVARGEGDPRPEEGETADVRWWHIDDVRSEMQQNRGGFIPSSFAALEAYVAELDAGS